MNPAYLVNQINEIRAELKELREMMEGLSKPSPAPKTAAKKKAATK